MAAASFLWNVRVAYLRERRRIRGIRNRLRDKMTFAAEPTYSGASGWARAAALVRSVRAMVQGARDEFEDSHPAQAPLEKLQAALTEFTRTYNMVTAGDPEFTPEMHEEFAAALTAMHEETERIHKELSDLLRCGWGLMGVPVRALHAVGGRRHRGAEEPS